MQRPTIILLILCIGCLYEASAQKLTFTYDNAGNQIKRQRVLSAASSQTTQERRYVFNNMADSISFIPFRKFSYRNTATPCIPFVSIPKQPHYHKKPKH